MAEPKACLVCGDTAHPLATFCKRCKKLLDRVDTRRKHDRQARVAALRQAWDGESFRCHYSGVPLILDNHRDPRYLTFDHRTPRDETDIVITAMCFNDMKSDLDEQEFRSVILQLATRFQGGLFDESVLELKHWKR